MSKTTKLGGLYESLFLNRGDYLAEQTKKGSYVKQTIMRPVTECVREHLEGKKTYATYSQSVTGKGKWMCFDIDIRKGVENAEADLESAKKILFDHLIRKGVPETAMRGEFSGRRGFHYWVFLDAPTDIYVIQGALRYLTDDLPAMPDSIEIDIFPMKSGDLKKNPFGSCVKLPCGVHRASKNRSYFAGHDGKPLDPLKALEGVVPWALPKEMIQHRKDEKAKAPVGVKSKGTSIVAPTVEPATTAEIDQLFKGCAFMREFENDPESFDRASWSHAGMVLGSLGQAGREWFNWISSKEDRYDPYQVQEIFNRLDEGFNPPLCATIGCSKCDFKSPLQTAGRNNARFRQVCLEDAESKEEIDLATLREEMKVQMKNVIKGKSDSIYLVNVPLGCGKSQTLSALLKEENINALWFSPTHDLADELKDVHRIEGWNKLDESVSVCPKEDQIKKAFSLGAFGDELYCSAGKCEKCDAYRKQFENLNRHPFVSLMHAHLALSKTKFRLLCEGREVLVFDENFLSSYRRPIEITLGELETLRTILIGSEGEYLIKDWIDPCQKALQNPASSTIWISRLVLSEGLKKQIALRFMGCPVRNVLPALECASGSPIGITTGKNGSERCLWFTIKGELPKLPIFILDSTGNASDYSRALGRDVVELNPLGNRRLKQYGKVYQVVSGAYPESSLLCNGKMTDTGKNLVEFICQKAKGNYGIISTRKFNEHLKKKLPGAIFGHYQNLRGVNSFENVDQLFVVGAQFLNYWDLAAQARVMFDKRWDDQTKVRELKEEEKQSSKLNYNRGGVGVEVEAFCPADKFLESVHRMKVLGEVEQAIGRARIFTDRGKEREIYILTNLPIQCVKVDETIDLGVREPECHEKMKAAAEKLLASKGCFTKDDLKNAAGVSERTYFDHIKTVKRLFALDITKDGRKDVFCPVQLAQATNSAESATVPPSA